MPKKVPVTSRLAVARIVKLLEELPVTERGPVLRAAESLMALDNGAVGPAASDPRQLEIGHGG